MRSRTPDRLCVEAVEFARSAAAEAAGPHAVGEHQGAEVDGDRVVTHYFSCEDIAYRGWRWAVTVARASRSRIVTLDETVLLPGPDALTAPQWVPWSERLLPGDLGPGDLLPTAVDDPRLEPGWSGGDEPRRAPADAAEDADAEAAASSQETDDAAESFVPEGVELGTPPARGGIADVAQELGLGRPRVLSRLGLHLAADRWEKAFGAHTPMAQAAPAACASCGFLTPIGGLLGQAFGVCANEYSTADGHVVSLDYGCGGHSEGAVMPAPPRPAEPILDELRVDTMPLHPERGGGSVEESAPVEELGHS